MEIELPWLIMLSIGLFLTIAIVTNLKFIVKLLTKKKIPMEEKQSTKVDWFAIAKSLFEVSKNQNKFVATLILVMVFGASAIALFQLLKPAEKPGSGSTNQRKPQQTQPEAENVEHTEIKNVEENR